MISRYINISELLSLCSKCAANLSAISWPSNNWSDTIGTHYLFDTLQWPVLKVLMVSLYLLVLFGGVVGNSVALFLVVWNRRMLTVTNIFIANLALSDITLCIFCLPLQLHYQLTDDWAFGSVLCRVVFGSFAVPIGMSTIGLFLIALDRYWNIVYPLRKRITHPLAALLIAISFTVSVLLALPIGFFTQLEILDEPKFNLHRRYCIEKWPNDVARVVYTVAMFFIQFSTPLCISATLYYNIYSTLNQRSHSRPRKDTWRLQRTNRILVAIVALFIICWLPWNLWSLVTEIDHHSVKGPYFELFDMLFKVFALSSACVNPFLYCWLNANFRRELNVVAVKLKLCSPSRLEASIEACGGDPTHTILTDKPSSTPMLGKRSRGSPRAWNGRGGSPVSNQLTEGGKNHRYEALMLTSKHCSTSALDTQPRPLQSLNNSNGTLDGGNLYGDSSALVKTACVVLEKSQTMLNLPIINDKPDVIQGH